MPLKIGDTNWLQYSLLINIIAYCNSYDTLGSTYYAMNAIWNSVTQNTHTADKMQQV